MNALLVGLFLFVQNPPPPPTVVDKVADCLYVVRGEGSNTSVYITDDGVILVDTKFERNHNDLVERIPAVTQKPIKYVINTHPHGDHTGGNALMTPAALVAHENAR